MLKSIRISEVCFRKNPVGIQGLSEPIFLNVLLLSLLSVSFRKEEVTLKRQMAGTYLLKHLVLSPLKLMLMLSSITAP